MQFTSTPANRSCCRLQCQGFETFQRNLVPERSKKTTKVPHQLQGWHAGPRLGTFPHPFPHLLQPYRGFSFLIAGVKAIIRHCEIITSTPSLFGNAVPIWVNPDVTTDQLPDEVEKGVRCADNSVFCFFGHIAADRPFSGSDRQDTDDADDSRYDRCCEVVEQSSAAHSAARLGIELRQP